MGFCIHLAPMCYYGISYPWQFFLIRTRERVQLTFNESQYVINFGISKFIHFIYVRPQINILCPLFVMMFVFSSDHG